MILRHGTDGNYEIYDIGGNSVLAAYPLGQIGIERTFAGLGTFFGNDATDMMLRNSNNGMFEVYYISNNNLTNAAFLGTVGLDWQAAGFAADPTASVVSPDSSTAQLVQAMAGFGGSSGAADGLNASVVNAGTSEQTFLTTPQHT